MPRVEVEQSREKVGQQIKIPFRLCGFKKFVSAGNPLIYLALVCGGLRANSSPYPALIVLATFTLTS